ncbi:MAG: hypothetical protein JOZ72_18610 [Alphaproteobacteria bacterium]|nr:hypothetical protein [Alphaproteobacteria bacterium]
MNITLIGMLAGFVMIGAAAGLAFKQGMTWQHVIVFAFGAVLAGISSIQIKFGDSSVNIGQTVTQIANASTQQDTTLTALNERMDKLQAAIDAISKTSSAQAPQVRSYLDAANANAGQIRASLVESRKYTALLHRDASRWVTAAPAAAPQQ